jgi:hypothetical protein
MVKASKHRNSDDTCGIGPPLERSRSRHALSDPLMGPCNVEIVEAILLQLMLEVPLAEDDYVIEALSANAAKESFAHGVHERCSDGGAENADTGTGGGPVEVSAELAVVVSDDQLGSGAERRGLAELLRRPLRKNVCQLCPRGGNGRWLARMCLWIVRFETRIPSLSSSPRMRSAPQSRFSAAMR